jgi:hypothetical protein
VPIPINSLPPFAFDKCISKYLICGNISEAKEILRLSFSVVL